MTKQEKAGKLTISNTEECAWGIATSALNSIFGVTFHQWSWQGVTHNVELVNGVSIYHWEGTLHFIGKPSIDNIKITVCLHNEAFEASVLYHPQDTGYPFPDNEKDYVFGDDFSPFSLDWGS